MHDLGEIYAGDTFLYSDKRHQADEEERKGIELLQAHIGNPIAELLALWDEQEYGESEETKLLKVMDRTFYKLRALSFKCSKPRQSLVRKWRACFSGRKSSWVYR